MNPDNDMTLADLCEALQKDDIVEVRARIVATVMKAYEDGHPYVDFGAVAPGEDG